MRKKWFSLLSILTALLIVSSVFYGCSSNKKNEIKTVKLNEVVRSVFYAPMYVAINEGFFKEEGLDIDLSTGQGADKTMQQVLSGSCDIGFCGPEQIIYIYNQKREDLPVIFAQLTQTDGSFLVGRTKEDNFKWESLKGKTLIGGRPGGMPEMSLEFVLKKHGLTPGKDVNLITNLAFTATAGAFKAGTGDYVALFEPTGSMLEKDGSGYIVDSIGKEAGTIPYTCYFATKSYIEKNPEIIEKFTKAIYRGQVWITHNGDNTVAESIQSFFPGSDVDVLKNVIKNYRNVNAFAPDPMIKKEELNRLMDIIQSYKPDLIKERPPFDTIVTNEYATKVIDKK
ncbi:ABC transporter substrate-binding protein [Clostridium sp. MB40-C1]|uniref:ABC transporter substrate-binding protein n=1 Tax=Clostridium sp. MB40-C1 TaxID=3070996 RepID=UPI0027DFE429|nr:ABC transporter substrate-binding protein [Clostridium sp. MB40-C1]WMJ81064.1 ABC transporter substrate-binding protein [Clostridium sp. MB40-C1]